jgi:hypothetical protein
VIAFLATLYGPELVQQDHYWFVATDTWLATEAGRYVWNGALGYVYQSSTHFYALPGSAILIAPVVGLSDHLGQVEGFPFPVPRPSAWLIVGPYTLSFAVLFVYSVRRLAWEVGLRRGLWLPQVLSIPVVLIPAYYWGHFEDVIALAMTLQAVKYLIAGRFGRAALYLSVAIAFKQWAMLLIPLLVFQAPRGQRIRSLALAGALPAALALFTLGVDWSDASRALLSPLTPGANTGGHIALFGAAITSRVTRPMALLLAGMVAWRARKKSDPAAILWAASLVLLIRPLLEPIVFSYYWSPALLLAGGAAMAARRATTVPEWGVLVTGALWCLPRGGSNLWWWLGAAVAGLAFLVVKSMGFGRSDPGAPATLSVKAWAGTPILNP